MRKAFSLLIFVVLMAACSSTPSVVSVPTLAILPSESPTPVFTPTLTDTPAPADTATLAPTLTDTQTPADTLPPTDTLTPTATFTPSQTPTITNTSRPTIQLVTVTSSPTPSPTNTPPPTLTPSPVVVGNATVAMASQKLVELQDGPGFDYGAIQPLSTGTGMYLIGRSWDNEWYQVRLGSGQTGWLYNSDVVLWISPDLVPVTWIKPTDVPVATVISFALGGHVMDTSSAGYGLAHSAGMTWIKLQYRFYVGQNTAEIAADIQSVHQNNFHILLSVVGDKGQMVQYAYAQYVAAYADFVSQAAALGADAIEVWNEPNIDHEWPTGMISGATYTQMLAATYTAIKARAPNTVVISAAPAPTGFFGGSGCDTGGCNDDIFFRQMALAGAQNYLDCVGLHHNDGIVSPMQSSGDPRGNYPTNYLTGVISRVPPEFNSKPLCFTEIGYLSPQGYGGLPGNFAWAQNTTVDDQAAWLAQAVELARSTRRVEMMIVWNIDFTSYTSSDPMAGYAILRPGGSCPACDALKAAVG